MPRAGGFGAGRCDDLRLPGRVMRGEAGPEESAACAERFAHHYVDSPGRREALAVRS